MSTPQQAKPTFKAPEQKPFKIAETELKPRSDETAAIVETGWHPISTAPQDPNAEFQVRAMVNGKGISGTETLVRYRASRKMVGGRWQPAFTIIDAKLGTKLGFRPNEWCATEPETANA